MLQMCIFAIHFNKNVMNLRVKEICKNQGITIGDLADKMDIKRESLSRAINGNPTLETLSKIAIALDVPISNLFDDGSSDAFINCPNCDYTLKVSLEK